MLKSITSTRSPPSTAPESPKPPLSKAKKVVLDIDSSESPVHGNQEGSAYNGYFESTCYHPIFCFNNHGDCERWIKEGKHALTWTRLSCTRFASNRVRLALFVLAHNLGNFLRRFALPSEVSHWSLSSVQLKLIKIGARIVSHSRMTVFQMAEVAVPEKLFRSMLSKIHRLGKACARAPALSL